MIHARKVGDRIELEFTEYQDPPTFDKTLNKIRTISGRRFDKTTSRWSIPQTELEHLEDLFGKNVTLDPGIIAESLDVIPASIDISIESLQELLHQPYPFQIVGIGFLSSNPGCMLADQMGLGKSLQIIGAVYRLFREGKIRKALIVCPSTLKYQWEEEIEKFVDVEGRGIDYHVIDGSVKERHAAYDYIREKSPLYTITNYELIRNDIEIVKELGFDVIALDEASRIRNFQSKTFKCIKELEAPFKWAATGTPIQNKPEELFTIFNWLNPNILGSWWAFRSRYIQLGSKFGQSNMILGYKNLDKLHQIVSPYMLRRLKKDVAPELPEMLINNFFVDMTSVQTSIHEDIRTDLIDLIKEISQYTERDENGQIVKQHPKANAILGMLVMMQEVCDSPELLNMSDSRLAAKYAKGGDDAQVSPKLEELMNILKDFMEDESSSHKAVIFTQFERMQRLIASAVSRLGGVTLVNGMMSAREKQDSIELFRNDSSVNFIIATDSMNYGVFAPYVANCWNVLKAS